MKILLLLTQSLDSPGGGGRFFPIAKALAYHGHQVTVVALHHDFVNCKQRSFRLDGVDVHYVAQMHVHKSNNTKTYYSTPKLLWLVLLATWWLTWHALKHRADVIHVCKAQPMNLVASYAAHLLKRTPVFVDSDDLEAVNNHFSSRWQQKVVAAFENWPISFVSGITTHTSFLRNHYIQLGYPEGQIQLVALGVDRQSFMVESNTMQLKQKLDIPNDAKVIVYVGSMSLTNHPIDMLLQSFMTVVEAVPDAFLLLVGSGENFDELQQLASQLGLADQTLFVGRIPREDVVHYYRLGLVSVDPRRDTLLAESSLSLKIVESLASGVPVVSTDIGDREQLVADAGIVVPPDDSAELANALITFLQDDQLRAAYTEAAQRTSESHYWDQRILDFVKVYRSELDT